jgi:hypothetical protein
MVRVTANEAVRKLLTPIREAAEIVDDCGTLVGYFTPASTAEDQFRRRIMAEYDPVEIAQLKASGGKGRTTAEIFEDLEAREPP